MGSALKIKAGVWLWLPKKMAALRKFIPLFDRVLVQRFVPETATKGGILLPEKSVGKMMEATVVAVGPGLSEDGAHTPLAVQEGDKVVLPEFGGTKIELNNEEFYIFREHDLLGKL